uniref:Uncharacterized protein n=1 Tax=Ciona intestinalis TaxID=7719 RepID=H2XTS5_CIOIN
MCIMVGSLKLVNQLPPSATNTVPVTYEAAGLTKYNTLSAISVFCPHR